MPAALKKLHDRENGFTLVELLIVVLIIGILAAVAIPIYLGIQQQGYKAAVRSDVNLSVKRVQVALTEGNSVDAVKASPATYTQRSVKGETVTIDPSTTTGAGANDFSLKGIVSTTSTPTAGPINYTYAYDSTTGKFTESDSGSGQPASLVINTTTIPDAIKDAAYSAQIVTTATNTSGSTAYALTGQPAWLSINAATGVLSGTPTVVDNYTFTVTATNGTTTASKTYTLNVTSKPQFTTTTLTAGNTTDPYTRTVTATGTPAAMTYTVTSGNIPTGTAFSTAGVFSGTPTATGTYTFTVTATNGTGSTSQAFTVAINAKPTITTPIIYGAIANGQYNKTIAATGTPAPNFTATGLPSGMNINASTGTISGSAGGTATNYPITVTATNTAGSVSKNYTLNVGANLLANRSFENYGSSTGTITPWNIQGANYGVFAGADAHDSANNLVFYTQTTNTYLSLLQDVNLGVLQGYTYSGGGWIKPSLAAGASGSIYLSVYKNGVVTVVNSARYTLSGTGWSYVDIAGDSPINADGVRIQFVPDWGQDNIVFDDMNLGIRGNG